DPPLRRGADMIQQVARLPFPSHEDVAAGDPVRERRVGDGRQGLRTSDRRLLRRRMYWHADAGEHDRKSMERCGGVRHRCGPISRPMIFSEMPIASALSSLVRMITVMPVGTCTNAARLPCRVPKALKRIQPAGCP